MASGEIRKLQIAEGTSYGVKLLGVCLRSRHFIALGIKSETLPRCSHLDFYLVDLSVQGIIIAINAPEQCVKAVFATAINAPEQCVEAVFVPRRSSDHHSGHDEGINELMVDLHGDSLSPLGVKKSMLRVSSPQQPIELSPNLIRFFISVEVA